MKTTCTIALIMALTTSHLAVTHPNPTNGANLLWLNLTPSDYKNNLVKQKLSKPRVGLKRGKYKVRKNKKITRIHLITEQIFFKQKSTPRPILIKPQYDHNVGIIPYSWPLKIAITKKKEPLTAPLFLKNDWLTSENPSLPPQTDNTP